MLISLPIRPSWSVMSDRRRFCPIVPKRRSNCCARPRACTKRRAMLYSGPIHERILLLSVHWPSIPKNFQNRRKWRTVSCWNCKNNTTKRTIWNCVLRYNRTIMSLVVLPIPRGPRKKSWRPFKLLPKHTRRFGRLRILLRIPIPMPFGFGHATYC